MTYDMTYDMIYDMIYARGLGHVAWDVEPGPGGSGWRNLKGMEERQAKTSEDKRRQAKTSEDMRRQASQKGSFCGGV